MALLVHLKNVVVVEQWSGVRVARLVLAIQWFRWDTFHPGTEGHLEFRRAGNTFNIVQQFIPMFYFSCAEKAFPNVCVADPRSNVQGIGTGPGHMASRHFIKPNVRVSNHLFRVSTYGSCKCLILASLIQESQGQFPPTCPCTKCRPNPKSFGPF
jgi:hypothetical protein